MKTTARSSLLALSSFLLVTPALASFAVVGANGGDGAGDEQYVAVDAFNQSVRINMGATYGSGGLFRRMNFTKGGEDYVKLCFATADHVVRPNTLVDITFAGAGTQWVMNANSWTTQIVLGGSDGNDDLAFVGFQAKRSSLNASFLTYIDGLNGLTMGVPTTADVVNYGFGTSGDYVRDGNNDIESFFWRPSFESSPPRAGYINHRYVNSDVTAVENFAYSIYNFEAIKWEVSNATTFGGINQGDSGGVVYQDGKFVGVNSFNTYIQGNDANGMYRIYELGSLQGANAFTQNNIDWLNQKCLEFEAVPEPSSMALLVGLGLAAVAKRRKSK